MFPDTVEVIEGRFLDGGETGIVVPEDVSTRCLGLSGMILISCRLPRPAYAEDSQGLGATGATSFQHCTIVTVSRGDRVFFGGNDDFHNRDRYYRVDPGDEAG